jgi:5-methylcytosine-specific restriction enzyme B
VSTASIPLDRLLAIVLARYPNWEGFSDPRFTADEVDYKHKSIEKARTRLSEGALSQLIAAGEYDRVVQRLEELGKDNNLLYRGVPRQGDLSILYQPMLDRQRFSQVVLDLLHGPGPSPERLERYATWVEAEGLPNKWTFPTYFLFLVHPDTDLLIKPDATQRFLNLAGTGLKLGSRPTGEVYTQVLEVADRLKEALSPYGPRDVVDLQSFFWVVASLGKNPWVEALDGSLEAQLRRLLEEFKDSYAESDVGRKHLRMYPEIRSTAASGLAQVRAARDAGQDVTDLVLLKFLPHTDTTVNRARGAWISVAPAINADVRAWFEGAGWVDPNDWPQLSRAILSFVERVAEDPDQLEAACKEFAESPYSRGFQTGMLTPILSALVPDQFILINNKSRAVVNHFLGLKHDRSIAAYPVVNSAAHYLINRVRDQLTEVLPENVSAEEGFDAFSHWLVAVKRYGFGRTQAWRLSVEDDELWQICIQDGVAGLPDGNVGDLRGIQRKNWEAERARLLGSDPELKGEHLDEVWGLVAEVREGDLLLATRGTERVLGIGVIVGPYEFEPTSELRHRVPVEWQDLEAREISKPGWRRRLEQITPKEVNEIRELPSMMVTQGEGAFSARAFELLHQLHDTPTREFYNDHLDDFQAEVEQPFQQLLKGVGALLPPPMKEVLETEKRLFSRIPKNDFGQGGASDFYRGAFYPHGVKRIAAAQLFLWLNRERLEWGFYLGEYADEQRTRFLNNVRKRRDALAAALAPHVAEGRFLFGAVRDPQGVLDTEKARQTLGEWLDTLEEQYLSVRQVLSREQVLQLPAADLRERILDAYRQLFPLVLLATSEDPLTAISDYFGADVDEVEIQPEYPLEKCAEETGFELAMLRSWVGAIGRKRQAIVYGPPGTGKTFMAERLARHLIGGSDGFAEVLQFHPAYAYEDFIQGIRPVTRADGELEYQMVAGRFLDFCRRAQNRTGICVLVIDEINRANLSRVFGELMYLLEYRDRDIPLAGGGTFRIPGNVRMLGTMNTADRSIALVDHALRRRFAFIALRPRFEVLEAFHEGSGWSVTPLIEKLHQINQAIRDPNYHLGITFFMDPELDENLEAIWRMEIEPYLEEHFFDDPVMVERFRWTKIGNELLG